VSVHASAGVGGEEACENLLTDDAREHLRDFSSLESGESKLEFKKIGMQFLY
jgi:hypothetical protein